MNRNIGFEIVVVGLLISAIVVALVSTLLGPLQLLLTLLENALFGL